jgi:hypothetical protein
MLTIDESRKQTQLIHQKQRESDTLRGLLSEYETDEIIHRHQNGQRLLRPVKVVNPYAEYLRFMDEQLRSRRDHKKYLSLIKAVTFLHQYQRQVKAVEHKGETIEYIEVSLADIELANSLAHEVLGRSLDELSAPSRELLFLINEMVKEISVKARKKSSDVRFSRRDIREYTKWSDHQVRDHLRQLVELEYVVVVSGRNGSRMMYELVYDGGGEDGKRFFMGLTDVDEIKARVKYDQHGENPNGLDLAPQRADLALQGDNLADSLRLPCG